MTEKAIVIYDGYENLEQEFRRIWIPKPLNRRLVTAYEVPFVKTDFSHSVATAITFIRSTLSFPQPFILLINPCRVLVEYEGVNLKIIHDYLHWLVEEFIPLRWYFNPLVEALDPIIQKAQWLSEIKTYPIIDVKVPSSDIVREGMDVIVKSLSWS